ncbi:MAG: TetR/AcrR family transcriptional regulator [Kineosporiaceae bacterium]
MTTSPGPDPSGRERAPREGEGGPSRRKGGARLDREAWVDAASAALREGGPARVGVERLAAELGVTKGSFYWHFSSRADLLGAALDRWEERATAEVIDANEAAGGSAQERLRRLLSVVTTPRSGATAELDLFAACPQEPLVAAALDRVVHRRVAYVAQLVAQARAERGLAPDDARSRAAAVALYAAYVGNLQLARAVPRLLHDQDPTLTADLLLGGIAD